MGLRNMKKLREILALHLGANMLENHALFFILYTMNFLKTPHITLSIKADTGDHMLCDSVDVLCLREAAH